MARKTKLRTLAEQIVALAGDYDGADAGIFESVADSVEAMIGKFVAQRADRERERRAAECPAQTEMRRRKNRERMAAKRKAKYDGKAG